MVEIWNLYQSSFLFSQEFKRNFSFLLNYIVFLLYKNLNNFCENIVLSKPMVVPRSYQWRRSVWRNAESPSMRTRMETVRAAQNAKMK